MSFVFRDRREAGRLLAEVLKEYADRSDAIVLALPRGGVPVAFEIARRLRLPLDVFLVRKLGVPGQEELAFGAIAAGDIRVFNENLVHALHLSEAVVERIVEREQKELDRRNSLYREHRRELDAAGKTVILVDDGLATGATMRAAIMALRSKRPAKIVAAVPVGSADVCRGLDRLADVMCVCAATPDPFYGVGMWYDNFDQVSDDEVRHLIEAAQANGRSKASV